MTLTSPPARYRVRVDHDAQKTLDRQARNLRERMLKAILALAENPRPPASRKLAGHEDLYRLRVGDWRIIYTVRDDQLLIAVIEIGSRGDVYRNY